MPLDFIIVQKITFQWIIVVLHLKNNNYFIKNLSFHRGTQEESLKFSKNIIYTLRYGNYRVLNINLKNLNF